MSSSFHHPFQKRAMELVGTSGVQLLPATGVDFIIKGMEAVGTSLAIERNHEVGFKKKYDINLSRLYMALCHPRSRLYMALYDINSNVIQYLGI
jgi:hypothetical protein